MKLNCTGFTPSAIGKHLCIPAIALGAFRHSSLLEEPPLPKLRCELLARSSPRAHLSCDLLCRARKIRIAERSPSQTLCRARKIQISSSALPAADRDLPISAASQALLGDPPPAHACHRSSPSILAPLSPPSIAINAFGLPPSVAMFRRCSHCGHNGHNSRTCLDKGFKLFGVRLTDSPLVMRKSVSMGNLTCYAFPEAPSSCASPVEQPDVGASQDGYVSDDLVQTTSSARERKKGVPWTEEEHRLFLLGLQKLGKGDWRGISRNFVKTRTPTQVASHAQKYFLRRSNLNKRRRRSSLFDITPDSVSNQDEATLEELSLEGTDLCPQLSYGGSLPRNDSGGMDADAFQRLGIPVAAFPVPLTPPSRHYAPTKFLDVSANSDETGKAAKAEASENLDGMQPPAVIPSSSSPSGGNEFGPAFPTLFHFYAWAGAHSFGSHGYWAPESKILKPTPIVPTAPIRIDESLKISELSLSNTRPVMEPTPLSFKLLEEGSRHSAFHSMPSVGSPEMDTPGTLGSAISVA